MILRSLSALVDFSVPPCSFNTPEFLLREYDDALCKMNAIIAAAVECGPCEFALSLNIHVQAALVVLGARSFHLL